MHHHNDTKIAVIVDEVADGRDIPTRGPVSLPSLPTQVIRQLGPVLSTEPAACDCGPSWYCADPENCRRDVAGAAAMRKRAA